MVHEAKFETDASGTVKISAKLKAGIYRVQLESKDRFGQAVSAMLPLQVIDPDADELNVKIPNLVAAAKWSLKPGEEFLAIWGSGYDRARAYVEIEQRGKLLQSFWTPANQTQTAIKQKVEENLRGGFQLRVTMVRENRAYLESKKVEVPWSNKQLTVKWERFVSKLKPGQSETWTAVVSGPDAKKAVVELVAGLYDASLDAYLPHNWQSMFNVFWQDYSRIHSQFENQLKHLQHIAGNWKADYKDATLTYRHFPASITQMVTQHYLRSMLGRGRGGEPESATPPAMNRGNAIEFEPERGAQAHQIKTRTGSKRADPPNRTWPTSPPGKT